MTARDPDTGLMGTKCPRCFGPKEPGSHDCDPCSRQIAENIGKRGKRTDDGPSH